jgi:ATP-dependent Clp protease adaptor protein ClpS
VVQRAGEKFMDHLSSTLVVPGRKAEKGIPKPKRQPRYHVLLWNDDSHTFEYVIAMLKQLFGHAVERGSQLAEAVDKQGRAILLTTTMEHAELKRDQIHAYGKDSFITDCRGSMSASIEPEF